MARDYSSSRGPDRGYSNILGGRRSEADVYADELQNFQNDLAGLRSADDQWWREWLIGRASERQGVPQLSKMKVPWGHYAVETIVPTIP